MSFVAQLDLAEIAEMPEVLPLPTSGSLSFFCVDEGVLLRHGVSDRRWWSMRYDPLRASAMARAEPPPDLDARWVFRPCSMRFVPETMLPDPRVPKYDPPLAEDEEEDTWSLAEAWGSIRDPVHVLGGHAVCIQHPMEEECQLASNAIDIWSVHDREDPRVEALLPGVGDWRLVPQVDSDDNPSMSWGDWGRIYYWMRNQDLADRSFDRAWMVMQCY